MSVVEPKYPAVEGCECSPYQSDPNWICGKPECPRVIVANASLREMYRPLFEAMNHRPWWRKFMSRLRPTAFRLPDWSKRK